MILNRRQMLAASLTAAVAALIPQPALAKPRRRTVTPGFGRGTFGTMRFGA